MTEIVAQLFITPLALSGFQKALLLLPLCMSISVVYKATRCDRLRDLPTAVLSLSITIVLGMYAVGVGLWAVYHLLA